MNIPGPNSLSKYGIGTGQTQGTTHQERASQAVEKQVTAADKAAFFMRSGIAVSTGELAALESELNALGMARSDITPEILLRAAILHQNDIALSQLFLTDSENDASLAAQLVALRRDIAAVLGMSTVPESLRSALAEFIGGIDTMFSRPDDLSFMVDNIDAMLDIKLVTIDRLFNLLETNPSAIRDFIELGTLESRLILELIARDVSNVAGTGHTSLHTAVGQFRNDLVDMMRSGTLTRTGFDQLFDTLAETVLAMGRDSIRSSGQQGLQAQTGIVASFLRESVDNLKLRLSSLVLGDDTKSIIAGEAKTPGLATLLRRSGAGFEWRLLLWYRSGRDPQRLQSLMRDDLKGSLMQLLTRLEGEKGGAAKVATRIGQQTRSFMESITRTQVDTVLNARDGSRGIWIEVPRSAEGNDALTIHREPEGAERDPATPPVLLRVTTSRLGTVTVEMRRTLGRLAVEMTFESDNERKRAESSADEVRLALEQRGYDLSSLVFLTAQSRESE